MIKLPIRDHGTEYRLAPSKIVCLGMNYRDHIRESVSAKVSGTHDAPKEPILFCKTPNALIGPESEIKIPNILGCYGFEAPRTDYEAELAVVVGRQASRVTEENALDYILGYTCANDVSQRNIQIQDRSGWFRGKSFDTFCPVGPALTPVAVLGDAGNLAIRCRLNGKLVQDGNTADMIFGIPEIVSFISYNLTLEPGDLVLTGTPAGVGPVAHGDTIEVEIEGIGTLRNRVADPEGHTQR